MQDPTENARREMLSLINTLPSTRQEIEARGEQVWNTRELQEDFEVIGFLAPIVHVIRKSDRKEGILVFQHYPRLYFCFEPKEV